VGECRLESLGRDFPDLVFADLAAHAGCVAPFRTNRCSQNETMTIPAGYSEAMEKVRELASASRVDGWFTVITRTLREWRLTVRDVSTDPSTSA
jgi:hypothetical protein